MARRSGLGKGLSALIPSEATGESDSALRVVPISHIKPNAFQPRSHFDEESMSALAASIREVGLLQPVLVREVEGRARATSSSRGSGAGAPPAGPGCRPSRAGAARHRRRHQPRAGAGREPPPGRPQRPGGGGGLPAAHRRVRLTHEQVAKRMGKGRATVTNTLRLLQLPAGASGPWPTNDLAPAMPGPCWGRRTGRSRRSWSSRLSPRVDGPGRGGTGPGRAPSCGRASPTRQRGRRTWAVVPRYYRGSRAAAGVEAAGAGRPRIGGPALDLPEHPGQGRYPESAGPSGGRVRHTRGPGADLPGHGGDGGV
jgi:hypothetical protein